MLKKLWSRSRGYRKFVFLTPFFVSLEVVMDVLLPMLMADLIDYGIDMGDLNAIWKYGLLLLLADTLSRSLGSGSALPVGAITSLLGAPFFIAIIFSKKENH